MPYRTTAVAAEVLAGGLQRLVDVVRVPLDVVARLEPGLPGGRPTLYLDTGSPPADLCWAMLDVLQVLADGPATVRHGQPVERRLSLVG